MKGKRIFIDPGHGGQDPGARGVIANWIFEKDINLYIAKHLRNFLVDKHYEVIMLREKDLFYSLRERVEKANICRPDIVVSIHCDASKSPRARGITVFHYPESEKGKILAYHIISAISSLLPTRPLRGVKPGTFYILRKTTAPAVLVECGFLTNMEECSMLINDEYRKKLAWAINLGITSYMEV